MHHLTTRSGLLQRGRKHAQKTVRGPKMRLAAAHTDVNANVPARLPESTGNPPLNRARMNHRTRK
eukprot:11895728-Alexandrium_andersonii.AAC.1